jgi:hypothetical protein
LFKQVRRVMKPEALLYLDEGIGSSRFRTPENITKLINTIRSAMEEKTLEAGKTIEPDRDGGSSEVSSPS